MSSIYIHIPFCRQACYYCDFHFSAYLKNKSLLIKAIKKDINKEAHNLSQDCIETIYFGGGTPSLLTYAELSDIFDIIHKNFKISEFAEITLEGNPDDLNKNYLKELKKLGINRLSIGIQSFNDQILHFLNRRHNGKTAKDSILDAQEIGFDNLNVDLIYGIQGLTLDDISHFLKFIFQHQIPHISAYHLGIEPRTVFYRFLQQNKITEVDEETSLSQYNFIIDMLAQQNYEHYEISNFSLPNCYSKHNMGYWQQKPYVGFGPSAHSYFNNKRRWNVRNNKKYIENLLHGTNDYYEEEILDLNTQFNDYIITSLRTQWGMDLKYMNAHFGLEKSKLIKRNCEPFIHSNHIEKYNNHYLRLTENGMFISDYIFSKLIQ